VKIAADTNVLVRAVVRDDVEQGKIAARALKEAELIAVSSVVLCEFVWVLRRLYGFSTAEIVSAIRALLNTANVEMNRPAVETGLAILEAGGDFADGVIAYEGQWLGGETFVSFDKQPVLLLRGQGQTAKLL
jgi:predicted nucleic-acid-binding protein